MNYTELKDYIEAATENTFDATDFAVMTRVAETKIYNSVQLPSTRKNSTASLVIGNKYLSCPTDMNSVFSFAVIDANAKHNYLLNKDVNFIREAYPSAATQGTPKFYAIFGPTTGSADELTFMFGPTPSAALTVELHYYANPASIATASTSWLGDNYEAVLVNAVLIEALRFMKAAKEDMEIAQEEYKQSIIGLKNLVDGKQRQDTYRSGQVRNQVL